MDLTRWNSLYDNNKRLDKIFMDKYKDDERLFEKNCIELLVEISEFTNETKVFKYWTIKKPKKEKMLEEYADVITMILTFYKELGLEIKELEEDIEETDILILLKEIYSMSLELMDSFNENLLERLFKKVLYIGTILEFKEQEVLNAIERKQKIIEERLNSDY